MPLLAQSPPWALSQQPLDSHPHPLPEGQPSRGFSCPMPSPGGRNHSPEGRGRVHSDLKLRGSEHGQGSHWVSGHNLAITSKDGHACQLSRPLHRATLSLNGGRGPAPEPGSPAGSPDISFSHTCWLSRTEVSPCHPTGVLSAVHVLVLFCVCAESNPVTP